MAFDNNQREVTQGNDVHNDDILTTIFLVIFFLPVIISHTYI